MHFKYIIATAATVAVSGVAAVPLAMPEAESYPVPGTGVGTTDPTALEDHAVFARAEAEQAAQLAQAHEQDSAAHQGVAAEQDKSDGQYWPAAAQGRNPNRFGGNPWTGGGYNPLFGPYGGRTAGIGPGYGQGRPYGPLGGYGGYSPYGRIGRPGLYSPYGIWRNPVGLYGNGYGNGYY